MRQLAEGLPGTGANGHCLFETQLPPGPTGALQRTALGSILPMGHLWEAMSCSLLLRLIFHPRHHLLPSDPDSQQILDFSCCFSSIRPSIPTVKPWFTSSLSHTAAPRLASPAPYLFKTSFLPCRFCHLALHSHAPAPAVPLRPHSVHIPPPHFWGSAQRQPPLHSTMRCPASA